MVPMRNPSRMPFFTQGFTRQPVRERSSGSAARTVPLFRASLNCSKTMRCSSEYPSGGWSNSPSMRDANGGGNGGPLSELERFQYGLDALEILPFGSDERQAPYGIEHAHQSERGLHWDWVGLDKIDFHQRQIAAMDPAGFGEFSAQTVSAQLRHFRGNFVAGHGNDAVTTEGKQRQRDSIIARQNYEIIRNSVSQCGHLSDVSRGFLDADDVGDHGKPFHRRRLQVRAASSRHVVEDDWQTRRPCDSAVVLIKAFLRRLVVVGRNGKQSIGAQQFDFTGKFDHLLRVVAAGAGEDRNFSGTLLDGDFDNAKVLGARQRRAFPGCAAGYEEIDAGRNLAPHQLSQRRLVQ